MATINQKNYSSPRNINLKDGILRFNTTQSAAMSATTDVTLYTRGTTEKLYFWNGATETEIGAAGGGGLSSWDELYDSDKTLTIDSSTLTFNLTEATGDGLTLSAASVTGDVLKIQNSGTGMDISGTSDNWYLTKIGNLWLNGICYVEEIASSSTGNVALAIDAAGSGAIGIGATSTGAVTITPALTATASVTITGSGETTVLAVTTGDFVMGDGIISVTAVNKAGSKVLYAYDTHSSASVVSHIKARALVTSSLLRLELDEGYLSGGYYMGCYDSTAGSNVFTIGENGATTIVGAAGSAVFNITNGDIVGSDTSLTLTDADNSPVVSVTNDSVTTGSAIYISSQGTITGYVMEFETSASTGSVIRVWDANMSTGYFLDFAHDEATQVFTVGAEGATVITSNNVNDAAALTVTGAQEGADMVLFDHSSNSSALATGQAIVKIDEGGDMDSGGAMLLLDVTGTPSAGSMGLKIASSGDVLQAINIDTDVTAISAVLINGGGVTAADTAVLEVTADGAGAAGSSVLRITQSATPAANFHFVEINMGDVTATNDPTGIWINGVGIDAAGIDVEVDCTNLYAVNIDGSGAITSVGGMLHIDNQGTPAAGAILANFEFSGTATNNPVILNIHSSADAQLLTVSGDVTAATGPIVTILQDHVTGAVPVLKLTQEDLSEPFMSFKGGTPVVGDLSASSAIAIMVEIGASTCFLTGVMAA